MLTRLPANMSDDAFDALEGEVDRLAQERDLLSTELREVREAHLQLQRELEALRAGPSELEVVRASLAQMTLEKSEQEEKVRDEQAKVAMLRGNVESSRAALMRLQTESRRSSGSGGSPKPPRRPSINVFPPSVDSTPRCKSSLGMITPPKLLPLGLVSKPARRSGSGAAAQPDDAKAAKLRAFRLGLSINLPPHVALSATGIHGSHSAGLKETPFEFGEQRRLSAVNLQTMLQGATSPLSASPLDAISPLSGPPSAPLRLLNRNNSFAVFEENRNPSFSQPLNDYPFPVVGEYSPPIATRHAPHEADPSAAQIISESDVRTLVAGLRIQLAESEEGRRASEMYVRALKDFIGAEIEISPGEREISLPRLPTDAEEEIQPPTSIWSALRLPASLGGSRRSSLTTPTFTRWARRSDSLTSNSSTGTCQMANAPELPPPSTTAPIFGSYSFNTRSEHPSMAHEGERSPTTIYPPTMDGSGHSVREEHESESESGSCSDFQSSHPSEPSSSPPSSNSSSSQSPTLSPSFLKLKVDVKDGLPRAISPMENFRGGRPIGVEE